MNTKIIAVLLILATLAGYAYYTQYKRDHYDFYKENPHLTKTNLKNSFPGVPLPRKDPQFVEGDYQFLPNSLTKLSFKSKLELKVAGEKKRFFRELTGDLSISSFGFKNGYVALLSEVNYTGLELAPESKKTGATRQALLRPALPDSNRIVLVIEPIGKIVSVFSIDNAPKENVAVHYTIIDQALRPLPANFKREGKIEVIEKDELGTPYKMNYDIKKLKSDLHQIIASYKATNTIGSPSQAASAGLSSLGGFNLSTIQSHSLTVEWSLTSSLPVSQMLDVQASVENNGQTVSSQSSVGSINWRPLVLNQALPDYAKTMSKFSKSWPLSELKTSFEMEETKHKTASSNHDELFKKMGSINSASPEKQEDYFIELFKALDQDPALIGVYREKFFQLSPGDRGRNMLLGALGFEGSIQAQKAMVEMFKATDSTEDEKLKVLNEFAISPFALSEETKTFLKEQYVGNKTADLATSSVLALGASISKDGDASIINFLAQEWDTPPKDATQTVARKKEIILLSMGNSNSNAFTDEVGEALESDDTTIRSTAVNALRFSQREDQRKLLIEKLNQDEDLNVRTAGAQSMRYQRKDEVTLKALSSCTSDKEASVRAECYRSIATHIHDTEYKALLEQAKGSESDVQLQDTLRILVDGEDQ